MRRLCTHEKYAGFLRTFWAKFCRIQQRRIASPIEAEKLQFFVPDETKRILKYGQEQLGTALVLKWRNNNICWNHRHACLGNDAIGGLISPFPTVLGGALNILSIYKAYNFFSSRHLCCCLLQRCLELAFTLKLWWTDMNLDKHLASMHFELHM